MGNLLFDSNEWTFESIDVFYEKALEIAKNELGVDLYPMNIEIISSDQMIDALANHGLPLSYTHWKFGKRHIVEREQYQKGLSGLAFEIILNTNPCIAFLMENNTMAVQSTVLAHIIGHNHFFKNNYLFKQWTNADFILDYLKFAKEFIAKCEEKYGIKEVEMTLDACHALELSSIDRYKRPPKMGMWREKERLKKKLDQLENYDDHIYKVLPEKNQIDESFDFDRGKLKQPEENLLYFIEKNAPALEPWQREICRIIRKVAQYFYPQLQTKVINEGYATFCHYYIMNRMYDEGYISEGIMLEFLDSHSSVIFQTEPDLRTAEEKREDEIKGKRKRFKYSGINPYALGFAMFMDIKRMCENPDSEDLEFAPDICNKNWKEVILNIVENYRDESFIRQYLGPKVIRKFKFFAYNDLEDDTKYYNVLGTHNRSGHAEIRRILADENDINLRLPIIQVTGFDKKGSRRLYLTHQGINDRILEESAQSVLEYVKYLWNYDIELTSVDNNGSIMEVYEV